MKMKPILFSILCLLFSTQLWSQSTPPEWIEASSFGGAGRECVYDMAISSENNWIWVFGNYSQDLTLGEGTANETILTVTKDRSYFVALYNEFFEFVEAHKIELDIESEDFYIDFALNGNGAVAFYTQLTGSATLYTASASLPLQGSERFNHFGLIRKNGTFSSYGDVLLYADTWSRNNYIKLDNDENAYLLGKTYTFGFEPVVFGAGQPNEITFTGWMPTSDFTWSYLAKYSAEGVFQWVDCVELTKYLGTINEFEIDGDGNVVYSQIFYISGYYSGASLTRRDAEGVEQFTASTTDCATSRQVTPMPDGGLAIWYAVEHSPFKEPPKYASWALERFDAAGEKMWHSGSDAQLDAAFLAILPDATGHVLFATRDTLYNYDNAGELSWKKPLPGYTERQLAADGWGHVYVADKFDDALSFDGAGTVTSAGSHDIYLAKLDKSPEAAGVKMSGVVFFHPSHMPMQDVLVATGDGLASDRTDEYGYYELKLPYGWTGEVSLTSHGFDLSSGDATYADPVTADIGQQDYWFGMAPEVEVSGRVVYEDGSSPVPGCTVTFGEAGSAATATDGSYTVTLPYGWSGSATVLAYGMPVTPAELSLDPLYHFSEGQNFTVPLSAEKPVDAALMAAGSLALPSAVTMAADGDVQAVEVEGNGSFTLTLPRHWSGTLTPTLQGYRFFPESLEASAYGDASIGFAIYDAAAPEAIFCGGDSLALLGFVRSSLYPVVSDTLPEGWDSLPLTLLGSDAQVSGSNADDLQTFVENGGALVLMQNAPTLLTGGADLSAAPWLGAASLSAVETGTAVVTVDEPLGTALSTGDALAAGVSGWSASGLSGDAITLSAWDEASGSWHSYVRIEGSGKVAYWGSNNWQNDAELDLFTALLNWARNANTPVAEETITEALPSTLMLHRAYPNPFNPSTALEYGLPAAGEVRLEIYDVSGRRVKVLESGYQTAGIHQLSWQADDESGCPVASGLYIARLQVGDEVKTQKLMLMK